MVAVIGHSDFGAQENKICHCFRFYFLGLKNHCGQWLHPWNSKTLVPWKKSYDKLRQCIIKQRHHLTNKGPRSQSYGFSSSHVWMWVLNHKEPWASRKWCFWIVEKTGEDSWESLILRPAAAAAKLLKSCPTLCDPIDGSPPGSPVPEILQTRTLEWVAIAFSNAWKWKNKVKSLSHVWLLATPWTTAHQVPPSMGFSRQEYWSGLPLPSPIVRPVNLKGSQPWIIIGRTDGEAEIPIHWPSQELFIGKDSNTGKGWGQEEKGVTEDG